jgi:hypothetical protein
MHSQNNKLNILILGTQDFNNSLAELKEHLDFNLNFFKDNETINTFTNYNGLIIDEDVLDNSDILRLLNKTNIPKLILFKSEKFIKLKYDLKINKPINIHDLNKKVIELITKKKFHQNSSIQIKNYILDKNEKKLKKDDLFIVVTEKEIQLLELLFKEKNPIQKKKILKNVWKYASDTDTHTVETHIYRLRKKIINKFNDDAFILNTKAGYSI